MKEKKYQYLTFDKAGNELRFDITELQYLLKDELLKFGPVTFNQMMEILKLTDEQANDILENKKNVMEYNKLLRKIKH